MHFNRPIDFSRDDSAKETAFAEHETLEYIESQPWADLHGFMFTSTQQQVRLVHSFSENKARWRL